jgi:hypothetical protein
MNEARNFINSTNWDDAWVWPDGSFAATVRQPAEQAQALRQAIREVNAAEMAAHFERGVQAGMKAGAETPPKRFCRTEREDQERALGRIVVHGRNLHPMGWDQFCYALARGFDELTLRINDMREEMLARPEEYSGVFSLPLWWEWHLKDEDGDPTDPMEIAPSVRAERTAAAFVAWVASPGTLLGMKASEAVLEGLPLWTARSRTTFANFARNPHFPRNPLCEV